MGRVAAEWGLGAQSPFWLGGLQGLSPVQTARGVPMLLVVFRASERAELVRERFRGCVLGDVLGEDPGATRFADGALTWEVAGLIAAAQGTSPSVFPRVTPAGAVPDAQAGAVGEGLLCVQSMMTG